MALCGGRTAVVVSPPVRERWHSIGRPHARRGCLFHFFRSRKPMQEVGRQCDFFTMMRHPIDRLVSAFYYCPQINDKQVRPRKVSKGQIDSEMSSARHSETCVERGVGSDIRSMLVPFKSSGTEFCRFYVGNALRLRSGLEPYIVVCCSVLCCFREHSVLSCPPEWNGTYDATGLRTVPDHQITLSPPPPPPPFPFPWFAACSGAGHKATPIR